MKNRPSSVIHLFLTSWFIALLISCRPNEENAAMPGFNRPDSDAKAVQIADEVMKAQGGRKNWDDTRYINWNFFGSRKLLWDKHTGQVRVEYVNQDIRILVNVNDGKGKVFMNGAEVTQADSLAKYLQKGKEAWINDSYWLVMPFKLKDSGVTLKYLGEDTTANGKKADVLQLTFKGVGVTPDNGYRVYVDKNSRLVTQWAFFRNAGNEKPDFVTPWNDYRTYGKIKLSGDRGERKLTEIQVADGVPEKAFTSLDPIVW